MEKNKIIFWTIVLISFLVTFVSIKAETINVEKGYVRFNDLRKKLPGLQCKLDTVILVGEIRFKKSTEFKFRVDSAYYIHKNNIESLPKPILYKMGDLLLPKEMVEAIFIFLIDTEVSYKITDDRLTLNLYEKVEIKPEEIPLRHLIIDAGHGGKDPGATAVNGEYEKNYTLKIAKMVRKYIKKKFPNLKIKFTRKKDVYVPLEDRAKIANKKLQTSRDTIFISLHCNSTPTPEKSPHGYEVYYLAQSAPIEINRESSILSNQLIDVRRDPKVQYIQSSMLSSVIQRRSILLAKSIDNKLKESLDSKIASRGVKKNNYQVLRGSMMPAVLIELGFISHPQDVKMLEEKAVQLKLAEGIAEGIKNYVMAKN
ncbi:MAG TPA: N-acetylmuramoyl-L-alanine amidase [Leptospiraceae bacterium]|nr:N-acetylmuramoyl-L-alanine amidase [Leptospiraceae bacterium]HMX30623.1 N-acetylmuramoyl-L-alanine amidase [Leptospiraceae bacterium]HMY31323.1 N-acetylmuramoyl-L-alanine amidase [Leptospiraceae bacterium]HMZ63436.1 N-acetylmuramoyl-L-alanine amidase [Leptospiraceae bacterium]HNA08412.1 N-acetylmuramoyl-L-alanine amidase [Leptospiraceae bacterium]